MFVISQNSQAVICDVSDGSYTNLANAWECAQERGATRIDTVVLTHYHNKHRASLKRLSRCAVVDTVALPYPESYEEYVTLYAIYEAVSELGCDVVVYERGEELSFFDAKLSVGPSAYLARSSQAVFSLELEFNGSSAVYYTSAYCECSGETLAPQAANVIICGTHGPNPEREFSVCVPSTCQELVFADRESLELAYLENKSRFDGDVIFGCTYRKYTLGD